MSASERWRMCALSPSSLSAVDHDIRGFVGDILKKDSALKLHTARPKPSYWKADHGFQGNVRKFTNPLVLFLVLYLAHTNVLFYWCNQVPLCGVSNEFDQE